VFWALYTLGDFFTNSSGHPGSYYDVFSVVFVGRCWRRTIFGANRRYLDQTNEWMRRPKFAKTGKGNAESSLWKVGDRFKEIKMIYLLNCFALLSNCEILKWKRLIFWGLFIRKHVIIISFWSIFLFASHNDNDNFDNSNKPYTMAGIRTQYVHSGTYVGTCDRKQILVSVNTHT
jgi:hypothetical protein